MDFPEASADSGSSSRVVTRNIGTLLEQREAGAAKAGLQERVAEKVTAFFGSMKFVYLHVLIFGLWIGINTGAIPGPRFDPSLVILAMAASVEAIFLSTFVLISQNRMQKLADERADLNLHVSLLAEHEVTRLIHLVREIAAKLDIPDARDPHLNELEQDIRPEDVLTEMKEHSEEG